MRYDTIRNGAKCFGEWDVRRAERPRELWAQCVCVHVCVSWELIRAQRKACVCVCVNVNVFVWERTTHATLLTREKQGNDRKTESSTEARARPTKQLRKTTIFSGIRLVESSTKRKMHDTNWIWMKRRRRRRSTLVQTDRTMIKRLNRAATTRRHKSNECAANSRKWMLNITCKWSVFRMFVCLFFHSVDFFLILSLSLSLGYCHSSFFVFHFISRDWFRSKCLGQLCAVCNFHFELLFYGLHSLCTNANNHNK